MATILNIEDDPGMQDVVELGLKKCGHAVIKAMTGEDGIEQALASPPQLILLDMMLPTLNGLEVLKALKDDARTRGIPVIVVTAFYGEEPFTNESIVKAGAYAALQKPVRLDELSALITNALFQTGAPPAAQAGAMGRKS